MRKKKLICGLALTAILTLASCQNKKTAETNTTTNTAPITTGTTPITTETTPTTSTTPVVETRNIKVINMSNNDQLFTFDVEVGTKIKGYLESRINRYGYVLDDLFLDIDGEYALSKDKLLEDDIKIYASYSDDLNVDYSEVMNFTKENSDKKGIDYINTIDDIHKANFNASGFLNDMPDFSKYVGSKAYYSVSTADQLIDAIKAAKNQYETTYELEPSTNLSEEATTMLEALSEESLALSDISFENEQDLIDELERLNLKRANGNYNETTCPNGITKAENTFRVKLEKYVNTFVKTKLVQTVESLGNCHVIEIMNDIDLGYYKLSDEAKESGIVDNFCSKYEDAIKNDTAGFAVSSMLKEHGISQIKISGTNDLLIFSRNGAKLTHAGFKVESSDRIAFRNLAMDEIWQWEDSASDTPSFTIGDMDVFGWAYFKIGFSSNIWIDHCTFGKAYDGLIDVSNAYFYSYGTAFRAPLGSPEYYDENNGGVHISNCEFLSGSDDPNGYLYKMMAEVEADYQDNLSTPANCKYKYYQFLRSVCGLSFDDILYGIAMPQKKAFLWGDSGDLYTYNLKLKVSLEGCYLKDIEDRLPNVRGGLAVLYNNVFDNFNYYEYYQKLRSIKFTYNGTTYTSVVSINQINSKYKCGMVSQGIIGGYNASIYAESTAYIGVAELTKNNNKSSDISLAELAAGYSFSNVLVDQAAREEFIVKSTDVMIQTEGQMATANFFWHNEENVRPFELNSYHVENLMNELYGKMKIGVNSNIDNMYLYSYLEDYNG